jgi:hypothetical protein
LPGLEDVAASRSPLSGLLEVLQMFLDGLVVTRLYVEPSYEPIQKWQLLVELSLVPKLCGVAPFL